MVTRVVGDEEGDGDRGNILMNNNDSLVPIVVYLASASLDDAGDDKSTGRQLEYVLHTDHIGDD
jgi:hypothetical protein